MQTWNVWTTVAVSLLLLSIRSLNSEDVRQPVENAPIAELTDWDHRNLERNLRWILQRERQGQTLQNRIAVFADAGVWHAGARSIVDALESEGVSCCVIDRSQLRTETLSKCRGLVLPGGWAPYQRETAGPPGLVAIKKYVENGGRCLAVCAGAYLVTRQVRYDDVNYPYPLGLFDGIAEGPVAGLAVFPNPGSVVVTITPAGLQRGIGLIGGHAAYYSGGPRFMGGTGVEILARYPDQSAAAIARQVGSGEVILLGMHVERPAFNAGGDDAPPPPVAGKFYRRLLFPATDEAP